MSSTPANGEGRRSIASGLACFLVVAASAIAIACDRTPQYAPITPIPTPRTVLATHVILPGETLASIARENGVTVDSLVALNDLPNPNVIVVGEVLLLEQQAPLDGRSVPVTVPHDQFGDLLRQQRALLAQVLHTQNGEIAKAAILSAGVIPATTALFAVFWILVGWRRRGRQRSDSLPDATGQGGTSGEPSELEDEFTRAERERFFEAAVTIAHPPQTPSHPVASARTEVAGTNEREKNDLAPPSVASDETEVVGTNQRENNSLAPPPVASDETEVVGTNQRENNSLAPPPVASDETEVVGTNRRENNSLAPPLVASDETEVVGTNRRENNSPAPPLVASDETEVARMNVRKENGLVSMEAPESADLSRPDSGANRNAGRPDELRSNGVSAPNSDVSNEADGPNAQASTGADSPSTAHQPEGERKHRSFLGVRWSLGDRRSRARKRVASHEQYFIHGTEMLRLGLIDEAERRFRSGLAESEELGWDEERAAYLAALGRVEEQREEARRRTKS